MKNFIYLTIFSILFIACSGGDDDTEPQNLTPDIPVIKSPTDNNLCADNWVAFEWEPSKNSNGAEIIYQIDIAENNQFNPILETTKTLSTVMEIELSQNTAYYWRIRATNPEDLSSDFSPTYKFYTKGEAVYNHAPFAPELVEPILNTKLNTTTATLKWDADDVDGDNLSYDVYFGTANPPTKKIAENKSEKTLEVTLEPTKEYFWKVVVKDNKGGESIGQVWKFKTN